MVNVAVHIGAHDDTMTLASCGNSALDATPRHHDGRTRKSAFQNFVPADDGASAFFHECLNLTIDPALQLVLGRELMLVIALDTQFFDLGLTLGTLVPTVLGALITANVDILGGEHLAQLAQNGLCRFYNLARSCTVAIGDYVVTSGEGIFPDGLLIGTIEEIGSDKYNTSIYANIKPFADITEKGNPVFSSNSLLLGDAEARISFILRYLGYDL